MRNRAVTIRCADCGLLLVGVMDHHGRVHASDRARPGPDDPVRVGICISCAVGPAGAARDRYSRPASGA